MPYYSKIILNSFYNRLFPKIFQYNWYMPIYTYHMTTPAYVVMAIHILYNTYDWLSTHTIDR